MSLSACHSRPAAAAASAGFRDRRRHTQEPCSAKHVDWLAAKVHTRACRFSLAALAVGMVCSARRPKALAHCGRNRQLSISRRSVLREVSEERKEELQSLAVTMLSRLDEDGMDSIAPEGRLDEAQFQQLVRSMHVECDDDDIRLLFRLVDTTQVGQVEVAELRDRLRSCEAITSMYADGVSGVLWTLVPTVAVGLAFLFLQGQESCIEFFTGYIIEDSLSVDNLFVFLVLFRYFKVPPRLQPFCLNVGIIGAVVLRGIFIYLGLAAVQAFRPVLLLFSVLLIASAVQTLAPSEESQEDDDEPAQFVKDLKARLPMSSGYSGTELLVQSKETGQWLATPLLVCIISIELSDIVFAVDSIPAIFSVTEDPLIVFTSNVAAILGLRSLYNLLAIAMQDLQYLEKGVGLVLGFVGCKLAGEVAGYEVSSEISLGIIAVILGVSIAASLTEGRNSSKSGT